MQGLIALNDTLNRMVWGPGMLVLLVGVGIYFTMRTRFFQLTHFFAMLQKTLGALFCRSKKAQPGALSPVQAMTTALAATMGTGNLVGVATALAAGGPGAIFWMWISAFFGMMTKYAEVVLAVHFREKNANGEWVGGPMYYIQKGLGHHWRFLSVSFALFAACAAFGMGNIAQVNSIAGAVESACLSFGLALDGSGLTALRRAVGIAVALCVGLVLFGGQKRIGRMTERLIPFLSLFYIAGSLIVLFCHADQLGSALASIFAGAFRPRSAAGGILGYSMLQAARIGVARGVFTNEAGLGSAPLVHASADVKHPSEQGFFGMFEVFADTLVVCTLTALVILCSGVFPSTGSATGQCLLSGAPLTIAAFATVFGKWGSLFIAVSILLFAFSTLLSWSLYGQRCFEYLFGLRGTGLYRLSFLLVIVLGATMDLTLAWALSDTLNGLMALPNLIALWALSPVVLRLTRTYKAQQPARKAL